MRARQRCGTDKWTTEGAGKRAKAPSILRRSASVTGRGVCRHSAEVGVLCMPIKVVPQMMITSVLVFQGQMFFCCKKALPEKPSDSSDKMIFEKEKSTVYKGLHRVGI